MKFTQKTLLVLSLVAGLLIPQLSPAQTPAARPLREGSGGLTPVILADRAGQLDEFGRLRVAQPITIFDSKLLSDKDSLFWDEKVVNTSGGASSTYQKPTVLFTAGAADTLIRQTRTWWNYQPGKSQEVMMTAVLSTAATAKCRVGQFHNTEGLFFQVSGGTPAVVKRTNGVDTVYTQANWNMDRLDGTGPSGITVDFSKAQIYTIGYEWLGVGRVRFALVIDGVPYVCHVMQHANSVTAPYINSPNLPLRYELTKGAGGGTVTMRVICSTVITGGGSPPNGIVRSASTGATHVDANAVDTVYAVLGIKLQPGKLSSTVRIEEVEMLAETNTTSGEWMLLVNPTVAGTFTFVNEPNSSVAIARGATANVISVPYGIGRIGGGQMSQSTRQAGGELPNAWALGCQIDTTRQDTVVLAFRTGTTNADVQGTLTWRELR